MNDENRRRSSGVSFMFSSVFAEDNEADGFLSIFASDFYFLGVVRRSLSIVTFNVRLADC
jgi:hypothetical protein